MSDASKVEEFRPYAAPIKNVERYAGWTRSEVYRRLAAGDIKGIKNGRRTLILMDSVRDYLASLPPAVYRRPTDKTPT